MSDEISVTIAENNPISVELAEQGPQGIQGIAGPNEVTTDTDSGITGILKGAAGKVAQAVAGTDYSAPGHTHPGTDVTSAVASATNADTVDGEHASAFADATHQHSGGDITSQVGDADTVDGQHASAFVPAVPTFAAPSLIGNITALNASTGATFPAADKTQIDKVGAFADAGVGDLIVVTGGAGATAGLYRLTTKTSSDSVKVDRDIHASGIDIVDGAFTVYRDVISVEPTDGVSGLAFGHWSRIGGPLRFKGLIKAIGTKSTASIGETDILTADGSFDTETGWMLGSGWTIADGKATHAAGNAASLTGTSEAKSTTTMYAVTFTITTVTSGSGFTVQLGGQKFYPTWAGEKVYTSSGTYTAYFRPTDATGTLSFVLGSGGTWVGSIEVAAIYEMVASVPEIQMQSHDGELTPMEIRAGGSDKKNFYMGRNAGKYAQTGTYNIAIGADAMPYNRSAHYNIAIGANALRDITPGSGGYHVAIGASALQGSTISDSCIAIGPSALQTLQEGWSNIAIGWGAGKYIASVSPNTLLDSIIIGYTAGYQSRCSYSVLIGSGAGYSNIGGYNVLIGNNVGKKLTGGTYNTMVGPDAGNVTGQKVDATNSTAIGNGACTTKSNQVVIGNTSVTETILRGNVISQVMGTTGGLSQKVLETTGTPAGSTTYFDIALSVPSGARLLGCQLRVDTALTAGETWSAAFVGGSTTAIAAAGQAVAKNTKINKLIPDEIATTTTNIRITRDAGNFTNGVGVIRAIVYYEELTAMGNAA